MNKEVFPKVAVVKSEEDIESAGKEFYNLLGDNAFGMRICTLKEAMEKELPLRQVQIDYLNKVPNDIVICKGVDELIPESYIGLGTINVDEIVFDSDERKVEINIGIKKQGRNDICECGSGKKFKKCCSKKLN